MFGYSVALLGCFGQYSSGSLSNRLVFRFRTHTFCAIVSNCLFCNRLWTYSGHILFCNRLFCNRLEILGHTFFAQSSRTVFWCNRLVHIQDTSIVFCNRLAIVSYILNIDFLQPRSRPIAYSPVSRDFLGLQGPIH